MTIDEIYEILDNEDRTISLSELKQALYELKNDCTREGQKHLDAALDADKTDLDTIRKEFENYKYYMGESNAFQICLDLIQHLTSP